MKCLRKILQERKILLPPILTDRHDGMTVIIKNKNECGSNGVVTVGNVPSDQLALADKPFGCGVIIIIRHKVSIPKNKNLIRRKVCVAVGAVVAKVVKKVLAILAGDKNGRKFLGYVAGIVLFIVLLPVIAVYGLFGWMAGGGATEIVSPDMVYSAMPAEYRERMEQYNAELSMIETTFAECGVSGTDTSLAKTIYISCLIGKEREENFYRTYADCFLNADEEHDPLQNISSAFGVTFTDADKERLKQLYGGYT